MIHPAYDIQHEEYKEPERPKTTSHSSSNKEAEDRGISKVEFFFTYKQVQDSPVRGQVFFNYYGETVEGEEVVLYSAKQDAYSLDEWLIGKAYATIRITDKKKHYRLIPSTISHHPIEDPEDSFYTCVRCADEYPEDHTIFMDNAPVCVPCAHIIQVDLKDVDPGHEWKLYKQ